MKMIQRVLERSILVSRTKYMEEKKTLWKKAKEKKVIIIIVIIVILSSAFAYQQFYLK